MTTKKAYEAPSVERLGTLAQITLQGSNKGTLDGGTAPSHKS